jgi:hypothetical protein
MAVEANPFRPGLVRGGVIALYAALVSVIALLPVMARLANVPISELTRDIFSTAELPVYYGIVSNLGVFLWCAGVTVAAFTALIGPAVAPGVRRFLAVSAALSAVFMIDDFFMVHEWLVPRFLGWPEEAVYLIYAAVSALYALAYRRVIRAWAPGLFVIAAFLLALSIGVDLLEEEGASQWGAYLEEGLKLLGIGGWLAFLMSVSAAVLDAPRSAGAVRADGASRAG